MDINEWLMCPSEKCGEDLDMVACTHWETLMRCPKCKTRVVLKRYVTGRFNDIFSQHGELSEKQREFLKGE